jgi:hypothetical protein
MLLRGGDGRRLRRIVKGARPRGVAKGSRAPSSVSFSYIRRQPDMLA